MSSRNIKVPNLHSNAFESLGLVAAAYEIHVTYQWNRICIEMEIIIFFQDSKLLEVLMTMMMWLIIKHPCINATKNAILTLELSLRAAHTCKMSFPFLMILKMKTVEKVVFQHFP